MQVREITLRKLRSQAAERLSERYGTTEARVLSDHLLMHVLQVDRTAMLLGLDRCVPSEQLELFYTLLDRAVKGEPLQYILGMVSFHGLELEVGPSVLIPRPETEELVQLVMDEMSQAATVIDIGTGSGCIALALKKAFPLSDVIGADVSVDALAVAERNATRNDLHVKWVQLDVLNDHLPYREVDLIVSNPPYIPINERSKLEAHVVDHEPHLALFSGDHPLLFYDRIAAFAKKTLSVQGGLYFEVHQDHADEVVELLRSYGHDRVEKRMDMSGNDRFVIARKS